MVNNGTGGAIFRNFYRDYLNESYKITENEIFYKCHLSFIEIADLWYEFTNLLISIDKLKTYNSVKRSKCFIIRHC